MNKRLSYLVLALLCLFGGQSAWAQEFDSEDGMLHYNVYDAENFPLNVEVGKTDATTGNITIPAQVTHGGITYNVVRTCDYAFSWCENLTGITLSEGIVQINGCSFLNCTNLTSVSLPSTLTSIGGYGFYNSSSLKNLVIPSSVVAFPDDCWATFSGIEFNTITFESCATALPSDLNVNAKNVVLKRNGGRFFGVETAVIGGLATEVSNGAFDDCDNLTSVTINDNVTRIGDYAFYSNDELVTVTINSPIESIGTAAFQHCGKLASFEFPSSLTTIGDGAFYYCQGLKKLTIPATVTTIGGDAFGYCTLDNLTIEDCSTPLNLGGYSLDAHNAYVGRPMLTYNDNLFWGANFDGTLELGGYVTALTTKYAKGLNGMAKLILGNSVQSIEERALEDCTSLRDMYVPWETPIAINENVFPHGWYYGEWLLPEEAILWVPAGTKSLYEDESAEGWKEFKTIRPTHYIVNLNTVGDGTLKVNETATRALVAYGSTNVDFVIAAGEDYDFASLNDGTSTVYTTASQGASLKGGTYTLPSISDDMTFTATFTEKPKFTIAATAGVGGTVNVQGGEYGTSKNAQVYRDRDAVVGVKCDNNYEIVSVKLDGVEKKNELVDGNLTIANIQGAHTVAATFQKINLDVTLVATAGGSLTVGDKTATVGSNKTAVIRRGQNVQLTVTPAEDYDFTSLKKGDAVVYSSPRTGGTYTHENLQDEPTFTATFTIKPLVTIAASATNGTVTPSEQQVRRDRNATVTLTPNEGHYLSAVTVNGNDAMSLVAGNTLTLTNIQENQNVVATFTKYVYTVSKAATENGTITLNATEVAWGENTTATITPAVGYMIDHVFINGVNADAQLDGNTLNINNVRANTEVSATFRVLSYRVTITGAGVTASNMYPQHGESVTITVAEDPDRELTSLLVNGVEQKTNMVGNTYTINNVTGDVTVVATFRSTVETITIGSYGVGTYACSQDLDFTGSELKAYIAIGFNRDTKSVLLSRVYDVPAGTGIYLKGEQGTYKIPYASTNSCYVNMLKGNTEAPITIPSFTDGLGNYYLGVENGNAVFMHSAGAARIGTNRAYLQIPRSFYDPTVNNAPVSIQFEEDMTGIEDIVFFGQEESNVIYNLNGQKVNKAGAGIHIINGKKVFIK